MPEDTKQNENKNLDPADAKEPDRQELTLRYAGEQCLRRFAQKSCIEARCGAGGIGFSVVRREKKLKIIRVVERGTVRRRSRCFARTSIHSHRNWLRGMNLVQPLRPANDDARRERFNQDLYHVDCAC